MVKIKINAQHSASILLKPSPERRASVHEPIQSPRLNNTGRKAILGMVFFFCMPRQIYLYKGIAKRKNMQSIIGLSRPTASDIWKNKQSAVNPVTWENERKPFRGKRFEGFPSF